MSFGYQVLGFGAGGVGAPFTEATGGSLEYDGNYKIHVFTGDADFIVTNVGTTDATVDYVVVAGGGAGNYWDNNNGGGAGGGGGYRGSDSTFTGNPVDNPTGQITISAGTFPIVVGAGGIVSDSPAAYLGPNPGGDSSIAFPSSLTSTGGGSGYSGAGGSGGGGMPGRPAGGTGDTPPFSPAQGFPGGTSTSTSPPTNARTGGGGGGASAAGSGSSAGAGVTSAITGSPLSKSNGKSGWPASDGSAGGANTGDGGSGGQPKNSQGKAGGSGYVAIRYLYQ